MASRSLFYRVAARLRGVSLDNKLRTSNIRTALYCDYLENEWLFKVNTSLLASRSALAARDNLELKEVLPEILKLRRAIGLSLDYLGTGTKSENGVDEELAEQVKVYEQYVESVLGKEKMKEITENGKH